MLSINLNDITLSLLASTLILSIAVLALALPPLRRVARRCRRDDAVDIDAPMTVPSDEHYPEVSVIVHARSDSSILATLLPMLLQQVYPAEYEVIVVNDGGDDMVTDVVSRLEMDYRNLYMTFAPARSRNLSRKKLAITLGVKAARYDTVAIVAGNCLLTSPMWLKRMMRHIAAGKQIVTGYGYIVPSENAPVERRRLMAFDTVRTSVEYLASALSGHLYRAYGDNVAYSRELFFANKGFSGSLNYRYGDDDIFISSIATADNYAVELSGESMVQVVEDSPARMHRLDKLRHNFTGRFVSHAARRRWGAVSLMWWCWTASSVAAVVTGLPSLVPLIAVTVVSLATCLPLMLAWRRTSTALNSRRLCLTVPFFFWVYPLYTLCYRVMGRRHHTSNFTWSKDIA